VRHEDGHPVREGTAALLDVDGERFWIASIHLKSGCFTDNDLTLEGDCRTLAKQIPILEDWFDAKVSSGISVVLLGDFNRQLDRGNDVVRLDFDDNDPTDIFKIPHRQELACTAFRPGVSTSIDYVLMDEGMFEFAVVPAIPKLDFSDDQISDHCPVFVDIKFD
jgi:endonuclease/exonuclease/phosphatase family metal-dependent hydrolase